MFRLEPLSEQVIVITGASSGIGLATARMAADQGAAVVLAARTEQALTKAVHEIGAAEGRAVGGMRRLSPRGAGARGGSCHREFWAHRHLGEQRRGGHLGPDRGGVGGGHAPAFRDQLLGRSPGIPGGATYLKRHGGALINTGSMASDRAIPLQGIYSKTKHADNGFS